MSEARAITEQSLTRHNVIVSRLRQTFGELLKIDVTQVGIHASFIEMGADSLFLLRASQMIQNRFGVRIAFRAMFEELATIDAVATYIDNSLPAMESPATSATQETVPDRPPHQSTPRQIEPESQTTLPAPIGSLPFVAPPEADAHSAPVEERGSRLERILTQQLQIMTQQLELLRHRQSKKPTPLLSEAPRPAPGSQTELLNPPHHTQSGPTDSAPLNEEGAPEQTRIDYKSFIPYQPIQVKKESGDGLSLQQHEYLTGLIRRVTDRTRESKRIAHACRPFLADNRASTGFRHLWKEMQYPLISDHASGSWLWDVDGNKYVDITMGFGALLFGHTPPFVMEALQKQIEQGMQLGAESPLAGEVARLVTELTGVERSTFCNSGTEAVMTALRLARTLTGRNKVVLFEGCYHGTFDGVMVAPDRSADGELRAVPGAPGVSPNMIEDVVLLSIRDPRSLDYLKAHARELAAVLIEPKPSRFPDLQPREFLHELRKLTKDADTALIFDEVVTGFRFHPGGAQALFEVEADLVTYGKAMGAGLPFAAVAGKAAYMDAIDGGMWSYGDKSYPRAETTFFAGTYFKHPLIMPAVWAVLDHVKKSGPQLQDRLGQLATRLVTTLNAFFEAGGVPIQAVNFKSLFRFLPVGKQEFMELFYYHLLEKGVYICETRVCYLSTAHTDEDVDYVINAVKESVEEMQKGGVLPRSSHSPKRDAGGSDEPSPHSSSARLGSCGDKPCSTSAAGGLPVENNGLRAVPITEAQKGIWAISQLGDEASGAYNQLMPIAMRGPLNLVTVRDAIIKVVNRHEALRAVFSADGDYMHIHPAMVIEIPLIDFSSVGGVEREAKLNDWLMEQTRRCFNLERGPLLRAHIIKLEEQYHILVLTIHHIITDAVSNGILLQEIGALYSALCRGVECQLPEPVKFSDHVSELVRRQQSPEMERAESYWLSKIGDRAPVLDLPTDRPRPPVQTYAGAREQRTFDRSFYLSLKAFAARQGCTLLMTLLAGFEFLLHRLTGQNDVVHGIYSAGQLSLENQNLVGYFINILPMRSRINDDVTFKDYLDSVKKTLLDGQANQIYPFSRLIKRLNLARDPARLPLVSVVFNLDRVEPQMRFQDLEISLLEFPVLHSRFDFHWNMVMTGEDLALECIYNTDLFDASSIRDWLQNYESILRNVVERPDATLSSLAAILTEADRQRQAERDDELGKARMRKFENIKRRGVNG